MEPLAKGGLRTTALKPVPAPFKIWAANSSHLAPSPGSLRCAKPRPHTARAGPVAQALGTLQFGEPGPTSGEELEEELPQKPLSPAALLCRSLPRASAPRPSHETSLNWRRKEGGGLCSTCISSPGTGRPAEGLQARGVQGAAGDYATQQGPVASSFPRAQEAARSVPAGRARAVQSLLSGFVLTG